MKTALTHKTLSSKKLPQTYHALCSEFLPRPIHDATAYRKTSEIAGQMAGFPLNADQQDYFEILCTLIEEYEDIQPQKLSRHDLLNHLIRDNGGNSSTLASILNVDRTTAIKLLNGTRQLTINHIKTLCAHFKISSDPFIL